MRDEDWIDCTVSLPKDGEVVMTKIDTVSGCRNVQRLMRRGRLWYFPDDSMYVYYTPTHWRKLTRRELLSEVMK